MGGVMPLGNRVQRALQRAGEDQQPVRLRTDVAPTPRPARTFGWTRIVTAD